MEDQRDTGSHREDFMKRLLNRWKERRVFVIYGCASRGDATSKYMTRYRLIETKKASLYLHYFHRSDFDVMHDHPWSFWSLILWRGYQEQTPYGTQDIRPGRLLYRPATWIHSVHLRKNKDGRELPAVTLVLVGKKDREWGFYEPEGWIAFKEYFKKWDC